MKRFHVHVAVNNLAQSTQFYSAMFGMQPSVKKDDYAKWMLEDPRVNFAISERGGKSKPGVNHLGFQAESDEELEEIHTRLKSADTSILAEEGTNCCYAKSDKYWVEDPSGIAWESFRTLDSIPIYGADIGTDIDNTNDKMAQEKAALSSDHSIGQTSGCSTSCCPIPITKSAEAPAAKACCNG